MKGQRGSFMVEAIVVLSVFSILGLSLMRGAGTSFMGKRNFGIQSIGENLTRNQMESVFNQAYVAPGNSYSPVSAPANFAVTANALTYDPSSTDVETVRVTVSENGQTVKVTDTLRSNR